MERRAYLRALTVGTAGLAGCLDVLARDPPPTSTTTTTTTPSGPQFRIETVTMELEIPWGAAFGPDGDLYLTERPGRVQRVAPGETTNELVADLTDRVVAEREGGLLGLAFHPDDPDLAFTYQTYRNRDALANRVVRHRVDEGFARDAVVLDGIPGSPIHDGGRIAFGSEGHANPATTEDAGDRARRALYVTTGDAGFGESARDRDSLAGKVLRVTPEGDPYPGNPFDDEVFTYGHCNPQGLAWRDGTLFSTEQGPDEDDEINVLRAGNDYGWPEVTGASEDSSFTDPVATYTQAVEPASATFYEGPLAEWRGDFFFGALAGTHLHRVRIDEDREVAEQQRLLDGEYGRLRSVFTGPDGHLYVTTSNRDGRGPGSPAPQDDRVLRIQPP